MRLHVELLTLSISLLLLAPSARATTPPPEVGHEIEAGRHEPALRKLELLYNGTQDPFFLYWRAIVLGRMGYPELGLEVLSEHRAAFEADTRIDDLAAVESHLRATRTPQPPSVWPWYAAGVGSAALGASLLAIANFNAAVLACTTAARQAPDCHAWTPVDRATFTRRAKQIRMFRIVGWPTLGAGIALVGTGAVLTITSEPRSGATHASIRGTF